MHLSVFACWRSLKPRIPNWLINMIAHFLKSSGGIPATPRCVAAGLNPEQHSGHSLRAGLVTNAAQVDVCSLKIRQQTAHKSDLTFQRYIRDNQLFVNNTISQIW